MKIMGFNFKKLSIERMSDSLENLKIGTNIDISSIERVKPDFFRVKEDLLAVHFKYTVQYEPEIAKLELEGNILLAVEPKIAREVINEWKDKKLPDEFKLSLFNLIVRKSNIKAIQLEDEIGLPIHVPMPKISGENKKQEPKTE